MQNHFQQHEKKILIVRAIINGFSRTLAEKTHLPIFHFELMLNETAKDLFDFISKYEVELTKENEQIKK